MVDKTITVVDFEASGLDPDSYPIQVAWSIGDQIHSHYICAPIVPGWKHWDVQAEGLHGISREYLLQNGANVNAVAKAMNDCLGGQVVYSDAPEYDRFWCQRLFDQSQYDMAFEFADFWTYLRQLAPPGLQTDGESEWQVRLLNQARKSTGNLREHLADHDVRVRIAMLEIAKSRYLNG